MISFGLVSVPVTLHSATREHDVAFHQFEKGTGDRIRYQRVNERTGDEVDYDDIVRGTDIGGGQYVMLESDELASVAPGRSRALDIHAFVDLDDIDPIYYQKTYYLAPGTDETSKTYALLREAMARANRAAIGTLVMRGREYLAAIRPDDDLLVLETMFFADEIRDPHKELGRLPGRVKPRPQELAIAQQLIDSMTARWNPVDYRDSYTDRVNELIDAKSSGAEVVPAEKAPAATNVVDLMDALKRSVDAARQGRSAQRGSAQRGSAQGRSARASGRRPAKKTTGGRPAKETTAERTANKTTGGRPTKKATGARPAQKTAGGRPAQKTTGGRPAKKAASGRPAKKTTGSDVRSMTKPDLQALARRLQVPGRSGMDRAELEKAVTAAQRRSRRAA
ncbi:non-homologous end joining protein Ku [Rugosimonospora africana]|uniref:Non-homologous end joining protein Ku n=1 Tax=Rugosimonospora africana TaxID=556532 RepID=A0A8J3VTR1_9ACTN|nr:non-homologous end joining protein Ku [Rugosimonospora africana]